LNADRAPQLKAVVRLLSHWNGTRIVMFQKPQLAIIILFLLFAVGSNNAQENSERRQGYLVGSMLYVTGDKLVEESLGDAAEVTVEL
jgi:hypothetical protein